MGVYLPNVDMPKDDKAVTIQICPDGSIWQQYRGTVPNAKAVPVPTPHGRMIDADKMRESIRTQTAFLRLIGEELAEIAETIEKGFLQEIDNAPTIIPAQGKGYILAPQEEYDGLKRKYVVLKSDTGECVENCFVLRPDKDKAAIAALLAYADATDNHVLAKDIRAWISTIPAEEEKS